MRRPRLLLALLLLLGLTGCGGGGAASGGTAAPSQGSLASSSVATGPGQSSPGLRLAVRVLHPNAKALFRTANIQQILIDILDPHTFQPIMATTTVTRDPNQSSQTVTLRVPVGTWILRVQGRDASGQAAGSRFEQSITVTEGATTSITANLNPVPDLASLQVTPGPSTLLAQGTTQQFTATGILTDQTTQDLSANVTWSSSNASVANISASGLLLGNAAGDATVTASLEGLSSSASVNVTPVALTSLQITPSQLSLAVGVNRQLNCQGVFADNTHQDLTSQVAWSSSNTSVASISSSGNLSALARGQALVTASLSGVSSNATVNVGATLTAINITPANPSIPVSKTQQMTATGFFSDQTTQDLTSTVTWSSDAPATASVSSTGLVTGVANGTANLTAGISGTNGTTVVTVTPAVLQSLQISPVNINLAQGATQAFAATGLFSDGTRQDLTNSVTWSSNDLTVLFISNAAGFRGQASALKPGQTVIQATQAATSAATSVNVTGVALQAITISPSNPTMVPGGVQNFTATGTFSDGTTQDLTTQVTWTSGDPVRAPVSNVPGSQGQVSTFAPTTTTLSAALGGLTGATTLTVIPLPAPNPIPAPTPTPPPKPGPGPAP